jgi:ESCRT-II complex subunit VPS22
VDDGVGGVRWQLRRGAVADAVSEDDLISAIKQLKVLGGGFGVVNIGNKKLVSSVPRELNRDHNALFELAQARATVVSLRTRPSLLLQ